MIGNVFPLTACSIVIVLRSGDGWLKLLDDLQKLQIQSACHTLGCLALQSLIKHSLQAQKEPQRLCFH